MAERVNGQEREFVGLLGGKDANLTEACPRHEHQQRVAVIIAGVESCGIGIDEGFQVVELVRGDELQHGVSHTARSCPGLSLQPSNQGTKTISVHTTRPQSMGQITSRGEDKQATMPWSSGGQSYIHPLRVSIMKGGAP